MLLSVCVCIQTIVYGNITGSVTCSDHDPIIINLSYTDTSSTDTAYIASISALAAALIVCVVVSITAIVIMSLRNKTRNKAAIELQLENRAAKKVRMESMYEDVTNPSNPDGTISTQDNVAYGHIQIPTH